MLFWVLMQSLLKENVRLGWFMGHQFQKGWLCMCDSSSCKFYGSLAKLGNRYNWTNGPKSSLDLDVIWSRNLLIWSQTRYHYATKSGNSQLHNRDLWVFVITLAARCHFGLIKALLRNNQFHLKPSDWLSWCAFGSEKEMKTH